MPRRKGFRNEDYILAQDIESGLGLPSGTVIPSKVCDAAEKWILVKLRARADMLWDKGYHEHSKALDNFCALLENGEL